MPALQWVWQATHYCVGPATIDLKTMRGWTYGEELKYILPFFVPARVASRRGRVKGPDQKVMTARARFFC
jgi:hypothetical protein